MSKALKPEVFEFDEIIWFDDHNEVTENMAVDYFLGRIEEKLGYGLERDYVLQKILWSKPSACASWTAHFKLTLEVINFGPNQNYQGDNMNVFERQVLKLNGLPIGTAVVKDTRITEIQINPSMASFTEGITLTIQGETPAPYPEPTVPGFYKYKFGIGNQVFLLKFERVGRRTVGEWFVICSDGDMQKHQWLTIARNLTGDNELVKI